MDTLLAGGLLAIVGSILYLVAAAPMARIYGGRDPDAVISAIRAGWRAYVTSQVLFGVGALVASLGVALIAVRLGERSDPVLPIVGAVSVVGGGALWALMSYDRTVRYERFFREYGTFGPSAVGWLALTGVGLAAVALLLLDAGLPGWVAYATWALVALQVGGAIVAPKAVPPQIYYLATLLIGIAVVLWPSAGTA